MCLFSVEEIRFIRELKDVKLTSTKAPLVLECELSKTGLKAEWSKDDKKLRRDDRIDITADGKIQRLTIEKPDAQDVGKYTAAYEKLSTSATVSLSSELAVFVGLFLIALFEV